MRLRHRSVGRQRALLAAAAFTASLVISISGAEAATCGGVTLPDAATVAGEQLVLNGLGVPAEGRARRFVVGLYLATKTDKARAVVAAKGPRQLVLHFTRDVAKHELVDLFSRGFAGARDLHALGPRIKQLIGMTHAAGKDDVWTFTYLPGQALGLKIGDAAVGTIEGADFFRAFLRMWIGGRADRRVAAGLLGGECG